MIGRCRGARSSPGSAARTARCSPSSCWRRDTRSPVSPGSPRPRIQIWTAIADRIELIEADLNDRVVAGARVAVLSRRTRCTTSRRSRSCRCHGSEPVLTAELAAVGVTSLLEVIREVGVPIRFYQASSSEIFGEPVESPQRESTPRQPADAVRRREDLRPLHHAQLPASLRDARVAAGSSSTTPRRGSRSSSCRARSPLAAAAIKLGLQDELRLGDLSARRDWGYATDYVRGQVADAAAGRARRLRACERRDALGRGPRLATRSVTSGSTGASTSWSTSR